MAQERSYKDNNVLFSTFVVIGGGIAGVSCAEQLCLEQPEADVVLISSSPLIKAVKNFKKISERLEEFDVEETSYNFLEDQHSNIKIIFAFVVGLNSIKHEVQLSTNKTVAYEKLCVCMGAVPKTITKDCPYVIGIRDTETIQVFQEKISDSERVVVVGNGGIATELVHEIEQCDVVWAIKDKSVGATFFDAGAAHFFLPSLSEDKGQETGPCKRIKYGVGGTPVESSLSTGSALGPDWAEHVQMKGRGQKSRNVHIEYECEVKSIHLYHEFLQNGLTETVIEGNCLKSTWPVYVELTSGPIIGCDFVISATGVIPTTKPILDGNQFAISEDLGLEVDDQMKTSVADIFAAGDVCSATWPLAKHWFQMRLWTQAKQMGAFAGHCMVADLRGEKVTQDICFDLFTHVTRFFGYKVVLLGLFNGQKLGSNYEILLRVTEREEYAKVVMQDGRMQGAVLIGETDLEETFENLILNQLDLSMYGEGILDSTVDIEDYFD